MESSEPVPTVEQPAGPPGGGWGGRSRRLWTWVKAHTFRTILLLLALFVAGELATIPWCSTASLAQENPGQTALMRQRLREAEGTGKKLRIVQSWVPLAKIAPDLIDAVIVAEDGTFRSHGGVDWFEVRESISTNVREFRAARGASTITQQLAKNLYLSTSKDPLRKAKELIITLLLEHHLSKDRILEIYLNVIEWGRGVFGIEAAARTYFGTSASALTLDEALRLAAVIPSPLRHAPNQDSRYVLRRAEIIRRRLEARSTWRERQAGEQPPLEFPEDTAPADDNDQPKNGTAPPGSVRDTSVTREGEPDGLQGH